MTVVQSAHQAALESLKKDLQGKILVDATARVDFRDARPPQAPSTARLAQQIVGDGVRVVAALQNVPSHALRRNLGGQLNTDVLVCADDVQAAIKLISLIESIGMRGFYAGGLDNAVVVEGITALLISINKLPDKNRLHWSHRVGTGRVSLNSYGPCANSCRNYRWYGQEITWLKLSIKPRYNSTLSWSTAIFMSWLRKLCQNPKAGLLTWQKFPPPKKP